LAAYLLAALLAFPILGKALLPAQDAAPTCGKWIIGNCNCDNVIDLSDAVDILRYLFDSPDKKPCAPLCDFDGSGKTGLGDAVSLLNFYFFGRVIPHSTPSPEEICDGIDNNCDEQIDEECSYSVQVSWDLVNQDMNGDPEFVAGYKVYVGTESKTYTHMTVDAGNYYKASVKGLVSGTKYYFAVTAYDDAGNESGYSNEVSWLRGPDS
jgi:hypothetical protein